MPDSSSPDSMRVAIARFTARSLAAAAALLFPILAASAQDAGAPRPGLQLWFQPAFTFAQFTADDAETASYSARRSTSLTIRGSYLLFSALSAYVEVGSSGRGSKVDAPEAGGALDVRTDWWDAGGGLNLALRCVGPVCPSLDVGGVLGRSREALIRDDATGRPLATLPIARYEHSVSAGLRLVIPKLRDIAVVIRHQEGLSNLARDGESFRSRAQVLQLAMPLTRN
jgi:hypothetical protein